MPTLILCLGRKGSGKMILIPNVEKEDSCPNCPIWSLCWDEEPTEDISKDRCPIVEIVRCKNCKYSSYEPHEEYKNVYICNRTVWTRMDGGNTEDDYCSYGERIE